MDKNVLINKVLSYVLSNGKAAYNTAVRLGLKAEHFSYEAEVRQVPIELWSLAGNYVRTGETYNLNTWYRHFEEVGDNNEAVLDYLDILGDIQLAQPLWEELVERLIQQHQLDKAYPAAHYLAEELDKAAAGKITPRELDEAWTTARRMYRRGMATGVSRAEPDFASKHVTSVRERRQGMHAYFKKHGRAKTFVGHTGYPSLDDKNGWAGIHRGKLMVIGAAPGTGKSYLLLDIANSLSGNPILDDPKRDELQWRDMNTTPKGVIFSFELSRDTCYARWTAMHTGIPAKNILSMDLSDEEFALVDELTEYSMPPNVIVHDEPVAPVDFYEVVSDYHRQGISWFGVDYIQAIAKGSSDSTSLITQMSWAIKEARQDFDLAALVLSQINRTGGTSTDPGKPSMNSVKSSGGPVEDADILAFMWPVMLEDGITRDGTVGFYTAKARNDEYAKMSLRFNSGGRLREIQQVSEDDDASTDLNILRQYS